MRYSVSRKRKKPKACVGCGCDTFNPKFCGLGCQQEYQSRLIYENIEKGNPSNQYALRRYLFRENPVCVECGTGEEWNGKPLSLQMDHIDGDSDNNVLSNVRLLCPNCHTQTETWCARNVKAGKRTTYLREYKRNKAG